MEASANENSIIMTVPPSPQEVEAHERRWRWCFQQLSDKMHELEVATSTLLRTNRLWLTLAYFAYFLISGSRLALYFYIVTVYESSFPTSDRVIVLLDACLSGLWIVYSGSQYLSKMRGTYEESLRCSSLVYVLFCVQYFSMSYWVVGIIYDVFPRDYGIVVIVLYALYGFVAEKSPNMLALSVYIILMCFLLECLVRLVICKCHNPWKAPSLPTSHKVDLPLVKYSSVLHELKSCAICLEDFKADTNVVQLPCHKSHVFHRPCLIECLQRNSTCPLCRVPLGHL